MESVFQNFFLVMIFYIFVYCIFVLLCNLIFIVLSFVKKWDHLELCKINMIVKLIHVPGYIAIFIFGIIFLLTPFTIGFSIFFFLYDCLSLVLSGIIGLSAILSMKKKGQKLSGFYLLNCFLQFVFCLDIVSSILVFATVSKNKKSDCMKIEPKEPTKIIEKKKFAIITPFIVALGTIGMTVCLILSETHFETIDSLEKTDVWYQVLVYLFLAITIIGVISAFKFKTKSNTKNIELAVEIIAGLIGFMVMIICIFSDGSLTSRIILSLAGGMTYGGFFFGLSSFIGMLNKDKVKIKKKE